MCVNHCIQVEVENSTSPNFRKGGRKSEGESQREREVDVRVRNSTSLNLREREGGVRVKNSTLNLRERGRCEGEELNFSESQRER